MSAERVLTAIGRLQDETARTWVEPLVTELVEAIAEDTTVVELRQEIAFLEAEEEAAERPVSKTRQFICSRCGRFGCLDRICHEGLDV